jgi:hypothetical protein
VKGAERTSFKLAPLLKLGHGSKWVGPKRK